MKNIFEKLQQTHKVNGYITNKTEHVFVLESPHVEEIKHGMPVSGSSGKSMSSVLFNDRLLLPLGRLIKKNETERMGVELLDRIGLINVCNIPMQKTAYEHADVQNARGVIDTDQYADFFRFLERVRTNQTTVYATPKCNELQKLIMDDFEHRMNKLFDRRLTIIPCGKFANKFVKLLNKKGENWHIVYNVPHPSYNNWAKPTYANEINKIKLALGIEVRG